MDLLYQRYADPFSFVDGMIRTGRLAEFVDQFITTTFKEKEKRNNWEYFLHKVWDDISFTDFENGMKVDSENKHMTKEQIETTVKDSMNILKNFNPTKGGDP